MRAAMSVRAPVWLTAAELATKAHRINVPSAANPTTHRPTAGQVVGESQPYQYLVESIDKHPDQQALEAMLIDAGFRNTAYENFFFGAAAMHRGIK